MVYLKMKWTRLNIQHPFLLNTFLGVLFEGPSSLRCPPSLCKKKSLPHFLGFRVLPERAWRPCLSCGHSSSKEVPFLWPPVDGEGSSIGNWPHTYTDKTQFWPLCLLKVISTRPFPTTTRVIWVPGIFTWVYIWSPPPPRSTYLIF